MTKKEWYTVVIIGLVLLGIFTFTDLQISTVLYTKNLYGRVFEVIGELPFVFFILFSCTILFYTRSKKNRIINGLLAIAYGMLTLFFGFMSGFMTWNYLNENLGGNVPIFVAVVIGIILVIGAFIFLKTIPEESAHKAITFAIIAVIYFIAVTVLTNVLKGYWGRMRLCEMTDPLM